MLKRKHGQIGPFGANFSFVDCLQTSKALVYTFENVENDEKNIDLVD